VGYSVLSGFSSLRSFALTNPEPVVSALGLAEALAHVPSINLLIGDWGHHEKVAGGSVEVKEACVRQLAFELRETNSPVARCYLVAQAEQQQLQQLVAEYVRLKGAAAAEEDNSGSVPIGVAVDSLAAILSTLCAGAQHIVRQAHLRLQHLEEPLSRKDRMLWRQLVAMLSDVEKT